MTEFFKRYSTYLGLPVSLLFGALRKKRYDNIKTFCCFIGYSRSGHTIVGSLLDAHPEITISTEADVFKLVKQGFGRNALYYFLEVWSKFISKVLGNKWTGYDYHVPGWYQGKKKKPLVIGDKKGSSALRWISANPQLPFKLAQKTKIPVKYVHVVRNPFDNIATMHNRDPEVRNVTNRNTKTSEKSGTLSKTLLSRKINVYFRKAKSVKKMIKTKEVDIITIRHEDLISNPRRTLRKLVKFLGVNPSKEYLNACAGIIFENPHKSRNSIEWPDDLKEKVMRKSSRIPFLKTYRFEE